MKLAISKNDRKRVQIPILRDAKLKPSDEVEIAVEVKEPHYIPKNVTVRSWIDDNLFTGKITRKMLEELDKDVVVRSVQVGQRLHAPKLDDL